MARPRKPTAQLELVGAFKHNPDRRRDAEPQCDEDVGPAPDWLTDKQVEAWDYLVDSVSGVPGVLTKMDRVYLELCAIALAGVWGSSAILGDGPILSMSYLKDVGGMLGKLGMTPSERSRVVVPRKEKASRVSGLARKA